MPDKLPPPWPERVARPAAIAARNRMNDYSLNDQQRREAAQEILRQVLGGKPNDLTMAPPVPSFWADDVARLGRDRAFSPYHRFGSSEVYEAEGLDPQISAAFGILQNDYPEAAERIYSLSTHPDESREKDPEGTTGTWNPMGHVSIRTQRQGKPRSFQEIIDTFKHELSHAMGAEDTIYVNSGDKDKPVGSYDVGEASERLHSDIRLPYEGSVQQQALRKTLQKK